MTKPGAAGLSPRGASNRPVGANGASAHDTRVTRSRRSVIPYGETGDLGPNVGHVNIYSLTDLAAVRRVLDCVWRAHPFGPHHLVANRVPHLKVIHGNFGHVTAPVQIAHLSALAVHLRSAPSTSLSEVPGVLL